MFIWTQPPIAPHILWLLLWIDCALLKCRVIWWVTSHNITSLTIYLFCNVAVQHERGPRKPRLKDSLMAAERSNVHHHFGGVPISASSCLSMANNNNNNNNNNSSQQQHPSTTSSSSSSAMVTSTTSSGSSASAVIKSLTSHSRRNNVSIVSSPPLGCCSSSSSTCTPPPLPAPPPAMNLSSSSTASISSATTSSIISSSFVPSSPHLPSALHPHHLPLLQLHPHPLPPLPAALKGSSSSIDSVGILSSNGCNPSSSSLSNSFLLNAAVQHLPALHLWPTLHLQQDGTKNHTVNN